MSVEKVRNNGLHGGVECLQRVDYSMVRTLEPACVKADGLWQRYLGRMDFLHEHIPLPTPTLRELELITPNEDALIPGRGLQKHFFVGVHTHLVLDPPELAGAITSPYRHRLLRFLRPYNCNVQVNDLDELVIEGPQAPFKRVVGQLRRLFGDMVDIDALETNMRSIEPASRVALTRSLESLAQARRYDKDVSSKVGVILDELSEL